MNSTQDKIEKRMQIVRGILLCLNVIIWIISIAIIVLCIWLRFDTDVQEWVSKLQINSFYTGVYILIVSSFLIFLSGFISCVATVSENLLLLLINIGTQGVIFVLGMAGTAFLMDYSAFQSSIGPIIKSTMLQLMALSPINDEAMNTLSMLQEDIGCCGANGVDDYFTLKRHLPSTCRDQVTGNAYFYGCADQMTWFLEQRSVWIIGLAILLCSIKVMNAVLSTILVQLVQKEASYATTTTSTTAQ